MTFGERVQSLTQDYLMPKVVDNVLGSNVLSYRLIGNAKPGRGESIKKAIKYQNSGTASSFAGLDTFTPSVLDTRVRMTYDMRAARQPIALSGMEVTANGVSDTQITDMVVEVLEETEQELADFVGGLIYGTGTGNSNKDFIGIGAIIDDGTDATSIGGLSRTTYTALNATRTASGGTMTLNLLSTLYSNVSSGSLAKTTPSLIDSNETVWDLYEQLLTPTVRETYSMQGYYEVGARGGAMRPTEGRKGDQGFVAVTFKGVPWVRDEKATSQNIFMINENWIDWYGWKSDPRTEYTPISVASTQIEGVYDTPPMSQYTGFNWSGFKVAPNAYGMVADVIILGNLCSFQPRRHGRLTGVTTV